MSIKNKLAKYEKNERKLGQQFLYSFSEEISQAAFTPPNSYSTYDGWYSKRQEPDASIGFEIKVRDFPLDKYNDYILEVGKLKNLLKLQKQGVKEVFYMNFFKNADGYYDLIMFNLSKRVPEWTKNGIPKETRRMNAATFKSKYDKVDKEVVMLKYDERYDSKIQNTQWRL